MTFESFRKLFCVVEQYSTWGRTYVLYTASFSCLVCVLTYHMMTLKLFLALFVIVFT